MRFQASAVFFLAWHSTLERLLPTSSWAVTAAEPSSSRAFVAQTNVIIAFHPLAWTPVCAHLLSDFHPHGAVARA